jgi:hypothetical protein
MEHFKQRFRDSPKHEEAYHELLCSVFRHAFTDISKATAYPNPLLKLCMTGPEEKGVEKREAHYNLVKKALSSTQSLIGIRTQLIDLSTEAQCSGRAAFIQRDTGERSCNMILDLGGATADLVVLTEDVTREKPLSSHMWTDHIGTVSIDLKFQEKVSESFPGEKNQAGLRLNFHFNSNWEPVKQDSSETPQIIRVVTGDASSRLSFNLPLSVKVPQLDRSQTH